MAVGAEAAAAALELAATLGLAVGSARVVVELMRSWHPNIVSWITQKFR
jgi:hypothetical protein